MADQVSADYVPATKEDAENAAAYHKEHSGQIFKKYKHKWSYQERYDAAIAAGMSPDKAKQYASASYTGVSNQPYEHGVIWKTSSQVRDEENEAADAKLWNDLLDEQRLMDENSPSAEAERRAAAGINDALTGGKELGTGDAVGVDDAAISQSAEQVAALNAEVASRPGQLASSLMSALGGVMNMINAGVDISRSIMDIDINQGSAIFDVIDSMSDLGNFFPYLNIGYDAEEDTWFDLDNPEVVKLDTQYVKGLPFEDFRKRIKEKTGFTSERYIKSLYQAYRSMASPKNINSYMEQRKKSIQLQNDTIDEAAKGVSRTGSLTLPHKSFHVPGFATGSKFLNSSDLSVFNDYVTLVSDLELFGLKAQASKNNKDFKAAEVDNKIYEVTSNLITKLRDDAINKNSPLANYLLVNMLSGSFNDIGKAAWLTHSPDKPTSFRDVLSLMSDYGAMSGMAALDLFSPGAIRYMFPKTSITHSHIYKH